MRHFRELGEVLLRTKTEWREWNEILQRTGTEY